MANPLLAKALRNALKQLNPENDIEYVRHREVSDRIALIEKALKQAVPDSDSQKKERAPRAEQLAKERCKAIAKLLWKQNPDYTIAELSTHPDVCDDHITGGIRYAQRTIYDWVAEADPRAKEMKIGRPRKKLN